MPEKRSGVAEKVKMLLLLETLLCLERKKAADVDAVEAAATTTRRAGCV